MVKFHSNKYCNIFLVLLIPIILFQCKENHNGEVEPKVNYLQQNKVFFREKSTKSYLSDRYSIYVFQPSLVLISGIKDRNFVSYWRVTQTKREGKETTFAKDNTVVFELEEKGLYFFEVDGSYGKESELFTNNYTARVELLDKYEPNHSEYLAKEVIFGDRIEFSLNSFVYDEDYFKFTVPENQKISFKIENLGSEPLISQMEIRGPSNYYYEENTKSLSFDFLDSGDYYISFNNDKQIDNFKRGFGKLEKIALTIEIEDTEIRIAPNRREDAEDLSFDVDHKFLLPRGKQGFFNFEVTEPCTLARITYDNSAKWGNSTISIFDQNSKKILGEVITSSSKTSIMPYMDAGKYRISIGLDWRPAKFINIRLETIEKDPDCDQRPSNATNIQFNNRVSGTLWNNYDKDFYKFSLEENKLMKLSWGPTDQSREVYYTIFDSNLNEIVSHNPYFPDGHLTQYLETGQYYVLVDKRDLRPYLISEKDLYEFEINQVDITTDENEPDDTFEDATQLFDGIEKKGNFFATPSALTSNDFFTFTLKESKRITITLRSLGGQTRLGFMNFNLYSNVNYTPKASYDINNVFSPSRTQFSKTIDLEPGQYWLALCNSSDCDQMNDPWTINLPYGIKWEVQN